jgi:glucose/arabinose dehydrogenase
MKKKYTIIIALLITFKVFAQPTISLSSFSTGYASLTDIANCGDSRLFITQQKGKIIICDSLGVKRTTPFIDLASIVSQGGGERGLLGLAFHPNYKQNGYFYINYTRQSDGATRVSRFSVNPVDSNLALPNSELNLLTITQPYTNHNGGNLDFGPDGYLYIGMGDGGSAGDPQNYAQNKLSKLGKMLRIDVNGAQPYSVPASNPFVGNSAYAPEIWAYGLRNPWKWSFDRITGDLWIGDVGQDVYEEVDFQAANSAGGENYGWRCYEGLNHPYNTTGCLSASTYVPPIFEYNHTSTSSCSVTGGIVYRGATHQSLFGYYLVADYCSGRFWWVRKESNGTFTNGIFTGVTTGSFVSFGENYLGDMYVATAATTNSIIYKINAPNPCPVAFINSNDSVSYCPGASTRLVALRSNGLSYQWSLNGVALAGATNYWIDANQPGNYSITVTNGPGCSATSSLVNAIVNTSPEIILSGYSAIYNPGFENDTIITNIPTAQVFINGLAGNIISENLLVEGYNNITVTLTDSEGCTWSQIDSVLFTTNVNIFEAKASNSILFPNPVVKGNIVKIGNSTNFISNVQLFDVTGKQITINNYNPTQKTFSTQGLNAGIYTIKFATDNNFYTQRLMIIE